MGLVKLFILSGILIFVISCKQKHAAKEEEIVETPEEMEARVSENIQAVLLYSLENDGKINDSIKLRRYALVNEAYRKQDYKSFWNSRGTFLPQADSLLNFIRQSRYYGLFPGDYHFNDIEHLRNRLINDSLLVKDAVAWTKADLMLTDGFMQLLKDLKEGRMIPDSVSIITDKKAIDSLFLKGLFLVTEGSSLITFLQGAEPSNRDYLALRQAIPAFVDSMDTKSYLFVKYPNTDSLAFRKNIYVRLNQAGYGNASISNPDSAEFTSALKQYQKANSLEADGKAGPAVVASLNSTDDQRFQRIAITLDRYKSMNALPETYVEVNIPSYYLKLIDADTLVMESKVVVGKPLTQTPTLKSAITNMVTYPQWTIPASIIRQDILPQLKLDPGYLARKGFSLVDSKGETVNPYTVDWTKYDKWIPWKVVQGSGDDNALGVFKFNFNNPYDVYLHDTNQRYLFKNKNRALSHGCVRVEKWHALALFIAMRDSMSLEPGARVGYDADSLNTWIAKKERKTIMVKKRLPLFINYFTCTAKNGRIHFYEDIYKDDERHVLEYFNKK